MSKIDTIDLDVLLSEKWNNRVVTTEHPVEEGAEPTDHARRVPGVLTLEAIISNSPIPYDATRGPLQDGRLGYATRTYKQLEALVMGKAISVETPARSYKNMQITDLARNRDSKLGTDAIQFTCALKEIFFVSTENVRLEQVTKPTSIPKKPTGDVKQSKQTPDEVEDRHSQLSRLGHWAGLHARGQ